MNGENMNRSLGRLYSRGRFSRLESSPLVNHHLQAYHAPSVLASHAACYLQNFGRLSRWAAYCLEEGHMRGTLAFFGQIIRRTSILALALGGIITLCTSTGRAVAADDTIKIGVVLPTTGSESKPGAYQKEGIELAIKQINDAGGIMVKSKGKKLKVEEVFYDDGTDSKKSASLTERAMSSDGVVAVLGGYSTALGTAESVM